MEYLARKARAKECVSERSRQMKPIDAWLLDDFVEFGRIRNECENRIIFKDVIDENGNWRGTPLQVRCIKLVEEITEAMETTNSRRLLNVATESERECGKTMKKAELAETVSFQADAQIELGELKQAVRTSNRCMQIAEIPECHLTKGRALLMLSQRREATEELRVGRRLANQQISRVRLEMRNPLSSEVRRLESELGHYRSQVELANALLKLGSSTHQRGTDNSQ